MLFGLGGAALAQDATSGTGHYVENWGLAPFSAIPNVPLSPEALEKVRGLEDAQLLSRRALEDRFAREMRALLANQAKDRDALVVELRGAP
jgi:hypothetical protein